MRRLRPAENFLAILVLALVYFLAAKFGLRLAFVHQSATAVWPPTGIALAVVLLLGYRVCPGIWIGAFAANMTTAGSLLTSIGIATGNTLEAVIGVFLLDHFAQNHKTFDRIKNIFKYIALVGILSTAISATFGVTSLSLGGFARWDQYGAIWSTWWMGDMVSALIITPFLVTWLTKPLPRLGIKKILEAGMLLVITGLVSRIMFEGWIFGQLEYPLIFLCLPFLLWAAFRFGRHGATLTSSLMSAIAVGGTLRGLGSFAIKDPNTSLLLLQTFMGTVSMTSLGAAVLLEELRETEKALHERLAEEKFRAVTETALDAIISADSTGMIIYFNKAAERIFGYPAFEALGKPLTVLMPERFREAHLKGLKRYLETGLARVIGKTVELVGRRRDGAEFPMDLSLANWKTGEEIFFTAIIRDITVRKQSEKNLRESEERFRLMVENVKGYAIFMLDSEGRVVSWNHGAERLKGYKTNEIIGKHFSIFYPAEDIKRKKPDQMLTVAVQQGRAEDQGLRAHKDGSLFWADVVMTPLWDEAGNLRGFGKVTRDITERKNTEEALKHKNLLLLLLQIISASSNQAQSVEDAIQVCLDEICSHTGWLFGHAYKFSAEAPEALVSAGIWYSAMSPRFQKFRHVTEGMRFAADWGLTGSVWASGKPVWIKDVNLDTRFQRKEAARELGLRTAFVFPLLAGNEVAGVVEFFSDKILEPDEGLLAIAPQISVQIGHVIERHLAEEALRRAYTELEIRVDERTKELREANEKLKELDKLKSDFILTASHELRTPLTSIKGYLGLILGGKVGAVNEAQHEFLHHIKNATDRLQRLLGDLLSISKIESGQVAMNFEETKIADLLREEFEIFKGEGGQKNISLDFAIENDLGTIECDQDKIREVITNLISNALKYTPRSGQVKISVRRSHKNIEIQVKDTGIGIKPEDQQKIFEPFHRVRKTGLQGEESTGLGLALIKRIVEAHHGRIEVESQEGVGSKFRVILPVRNRG